MAKPATNLFTSYPAFSAARYVTGAIAIGNNRRKGQTIFHYDITDHLHLNDIFNGCFPDGFTRDR